MQAAKAAGAIVSFDLNYREKLWNIWGGHERALSVIAKIAHYVDVLVGNEEDLQKGLGIPGPEVEKKSKLDLAVFFGMIEAVVKKYPNVKIVATTLREVHHTNHHSWGAVAWVNGKTFVSPTCDVNVLDRVGGGDGFASGFFYGLLSDDEPDGSGQARVGARRASHDLSGRYDHGNRRTGAGFCKGRIGAHSTLDTIHRIKGLTGLKEANAMMLYEKGSPDTVLSPEEMREGMFTALRAFGAISSMLIVPPDITRFHSRAGELTRSAYEYFPSAVSGIVPALGTHCPMTEIRD